jgi:hypothetical protein
MDHEFIGRNREIRGRSFDNSIELSLRSNLTSPIESPMESCVTASDQAAAGLKLKNGEAIAETLQ